MTTQTIERPARVDVVAGTERSLSERAANREEQIVAALVRLRRCLPAADDAAKARARRQLFG